MPPFLVGHATHPDALMAIGLAAAQVDAAAASAAAAPTLGFFYFTDHLAAQAETALAELRRRWPGVAWVGCVGIGVLASGVEYLDEPALVLMLAALPPGSFEVFSGARKLQAGPAPYTALVHADPGTPDLPELVAEMSERVATGYLFGGLASSRTTAWHIADGVWQGGLSGVAFSADVALVSRVTQGCQPVGDTREVTGCERNLITRLDGHDALQCLLHDTGVVSLEDPRAALQQLRGTLVGLTDAGGTALARRGQFGTDTRVRHIIGLDPARQAVAVADVVQPGMRAAFCQRDVQAARRDLVRICSEVRDEVESAAPARRICGALYVSCTGRGGPHFGGPSAELKIIQHALGDVPMAGFFAAGEIARHYLYGYTGVLTVFTAGA